MKQTFILFALILAIGIQSCNQSARVVCPDYKTTIKKRYAKVKEGQKIQAKPFEENQLASIDLNEVENSLPSTQMEVGSNLSFVTPSVVQAGDRASDSELSLPVLSFSMNTTAEKAQQSFLTNKKENKPSFRISGLKEQIIKKKIEKAVSKAMDKPGSGKSQIVAALLAFFIGGLGIHRFYLGYTTIGIVQLLTLGGCGIWSLIDFIRILIGDLKPKGAEYEKTL
jgi:TM2 domain-containing membrane protein YozV